MGNPKITKIPVRNGKIILPKGKGIQEQQVKSESVFTTGTSVKEQVAPEIKPPVALTKNIPSAQQSKRFRFRLNKPLCIKTAWWLLPVSIAIWEYIEFVNNGKGLFSRHSNLKYADTCYTKEDSAVLIAKNIISGVKEDKKGESKSNFSQKTNYINNFDYDYDYLTIDQLVKHIDEASRNGVQQISSELYNKRTKKQLQININAENPMVVNKTNVNRTAEVQGAVLPKTKTNIKLNPEIKEESKFVKKYVTDFIKRALISEPSANTETVNAFIKEFGYKPNVDEIADYIIAKKGDCVSRIMEKEAVKQLGRNLNKKEKAIIASMANKVTIGRKTSIDNPEDNNRIMPGDTIPTSEIKVLFN